MPVEFVLLGYPILDSPALPGDGGDGAGDDGAGDATDAGPGADTAVPRPPKMSDPVGIMTGPGNHRHPSRQPCGRHPEPGA